MTHFVVIMPYCLPEVQNMLTNHFKERGFGWWHWGNECWLLAIHNDGVDAAGVRTIIHEVIIPEVWFLVLRVDMPLPGANWALAGPSPQIQNWGTWLRQHWEHPDRQKQP